MNIISKFADQYVRRNKEKAYLTQKERKKYTRTEITEICNSFLECFRQTVLEEAEKSRITKDEESKVIAIFAGIGRMKMDFRPERTFNLPNKGSREGKKHTIPSSYTLKFSTSSTLKNLLFTNPVVATE